MQLLFDNFEQLIDAPNGIQKLRELILRLTVRGKLVEQDRNEKQTLSSLKNANDLPRGWIWQKLPNVVSKYPNSIKRGPFGSSIKKDFFVPRGYKVYEQRNAIYNDFSLGNYFIDDDKFNELNSFELKPNDIIISCSGTIGKAAIAPQNIQKGVINQALLKLTLNNDVISNQYFLILLPAYLMKTDMLDELKGTAIKNIVSVKQLKELFFPLPPFEEQKRIVAKVDQLMSLCNQLEKQKEQRDKKRISLNHAALNKLISSREPSTFQKHWQRIVNHFDLLYDVPENVAELKKAILQLAVMGKLVPQNSNDEPASELLKRIQAEKKKLIREGKIKKEKPLPPISEEEIPYELPRGWEWVRFGNIAINRDGERIPLSKEVRATRRGEYDYYGASGVIDKIDDYLFDKPLFLIGEDGANLINRSTPIAFIAFGKYWVNNHAHVIDSIDISVLKYLELHINSINLKPYITGTAQPKMNQAKMNSILIAFSPYEEQKRIVAKVNALMKLCDELEEKLNQSRKESERLLEAVVQRIISPK